MMKLETAQPSCECMSEPQAVRDAASVNQEFLFVAFDRSCSAATWLLEEFSQDRALSGRSAHKG
jgi:hypothetical protein